MVSIQPSERWTWAMRNSSMRPLKGSAMPLTRRAYRVEFKFRGDWKRSALARRIERAEILQEPLGRLYILAGSQQLQPLFARDRQDLA